MCDAGASENARNGCKVVTMTEEWQTFTMSGAGLSRFALDGWENGMRDKNGGD